MGEGFLAALQDSFMDLLCPEEELAIALEALVDELLGWVSESGGSVDCSLLERVAEALEPLGPCAERKLLEGALPLVDQVVTAGKPGHCWQLLAVLRQTLGSLKAKSGMLCQAA